MFELGQWVIDTRKKISAEVKAVIKGEIVLYVLYGYEIDEYYIQDEYSIIPYCKKWFEERKNKNE